MRQLFRIPPALPVSAYQTYQISAPVATHHRIATCAEVDCPRLRQGWETVLDERTADGARRAHYIRKLSSKTFRERPDPSGLTVFTFSAGQDCFARHHIQLEREPIYVVRGGDWRAHLGQRRVHTRPEHWVEDFATNQDKISALVRKG